MSEDSGWATVSVVLSAAATLVDGIHARVVAQGFDDLRPAHGFAFLRISPHGATVGEIAEHLDVTKQAASQLVEELSQKGYVRRTAHPTDARARLVVLTERGQACTRAAEQAVEQVVAEWTRVLGVRRSARLRADLARVVPSHRLRPVW